MPVSTLPADQPSQVNLDLGTSPPEMARPSLELGKAFAGEDRRASIAGPIIAVAGSIAFWTALATFLG